MLLFKIFDHAAGIWAADHLPGLHCYSQFLLQENGEVTEAVTCYQSPAFSALNEDQTFINYKGIVKEPLKAAKLRYTVCPWTGAKDSDGEKIYAGDILDIGSITYTVKYDYDVLMWIATDNEKDPFTFALSYLLLHKTKIIGSSIK